MSTKQNERRGGRKEGDLEGVLKECKKLNDRDGGRRVVLVRSNRKVSRTYNIAYDHQERLVYGFKEDKVQPHLPTSEEQEEPSEGSYGSKQEVNNSETSSDIQANVKLQDKTSSKHGNQMIQPKIREDSFGKGLPKKEKEEIPVAEPPETTGKDETETEEEKVEQPEEVKPPPEEPTDQPEKPKKEEDGEEAKKQENEAGKEEEEVTVGPLEPIEPSEEVKKPGVKETRPVARMKKEEQQKQIDLLQQVLEKETERLKKREQDIKTSYQTERLPTKEKSRTKSRFSSESSSGNQSILSRDPSPERIVSKSSLDEKDRVSQLLGQKNRRPFHHHRHHSKPGGKPSANQATLRASRQVSSTTGSIRSTTGTPSQAKPVVERSQSPAHLAKSFLGGTSKQSSGGPSVLSKSPAPAKSASRLPSKTNPKDPPSKTVALAGTLTAKVASNPPTAPTKVLGSSYRQQQELEAEERRKRRQAREEAEAKTKRR